VGVDIPETAAEAINDWLNAFPADRVRSELQSLERQRHQLDERISVLRRRLALWESAKAADENGIVTDPRLLPSKRQAISQILDEHPLRTFRLVEIREALVARGWLEVNHRSIHALEVAAAAMAKRGEIVRPRRGYYRARALP
jgi:hypothetical protein